MTWWPDYPGQDYARGRLHDTSRSPLETAGDLSLIMATDAPHAYRLGWRTLTTTEAGDLLTAYQRGGADHGLYFLEWRLLAESNLVIGTGTGSGDITFDLTCRLKNDDATAAGLTVTKNNIPVAYTLATNTGTNYVEHRVTISAANNTNGSTFRASWTDARRRRSLRAVSFATTPRGNTGLWTARAEMVEV